MILIPNNQFVMAVTVTNKVLLIFTEPDTCPPLHLSYSIIIFKTRSSCIKYNLGLKCNMQITCSILRNEINLLTNRPVSITIRLADKNTCMPFIEIMLIAENVSLFLWCLGLIL